MKGKNICICHMYWCLIEDCWAFFNRYRKLTKNCAFFCHFRNIILSYWSSYLLSNRKFLENAQKRVIWITFSQTLLSHIGAKIIFQIKKKISNLESLEYQRFNFDLVLWWKVMCNLLDIISSKIFQFDLSCFLEIDRGITSNSLKNIATQVMSCKVSNFLSHQRRIVSNRQRIDFFIFLTFVEWVRLNIYGCSYVLNVLSSRLLFCKCFALFRCSCLHNFLDIFLFESVE